MESGRHDRFLADVLRKARPEFAFVTDLSYQADLPAELVWVMVSALVRETGFTVNKAAKIVLDYIERKDAEIPRLMGMWTATEALDREEAQERRRRQFQH